MNKIREEEGVFILFLVTIAVSKENKGEGRLIFHLLHLPKLRKERLKKKETKAFGHGYPKLKVCIVIFILIDYEIKLISA